MAESYCYSVKTESIVKACLESVIRFGNSNRCSGLQAVYLQW